MYVKDPRAAALMSGDIDQVFSAFGLQPGFLNRKQFLAQHPEIIEFINAKLGEQRIQSNAEGYRGTSAENGAYIEFFKQHVPELKGMVEDSSDAPQTATISNDQPSLGQEVPVIQPTNVFSPTGTSEQFVDSELTQPPLVDQKDTILEPITTDSAQQPTLENNNTELIQESAVSAKFEEPNIEMNDNANQASQEDMALQAPETENITDTKEAAEIKSLDELEELSWWPMDDINLEIKDDHHAIMELVHGSGLAKRSVIWHVNLLESGEIWIYTSDQSVPQNERDQTINFNEFRELIESTFF